MERILYRAYDENEKLIYIGQSTRFSERMKQHIKSSEWSGLVDTWKLQRFDTQEKLSTQEKIAIEKEKPLYNKTHNLYYRQNIEELKANNKKLIVVIKQKDRELKKYKDHRDSLVRTTTKIKQQDRELQVYRQGVIKQKDRELKKYIKGLKFENKKLTSESLVRNRTEEEKKAIISENIKAGIVRAREKGVRFGRPPIPFAKELIEAKLVEGKSIRETAKELKVSIGTVSRIRKVLSDANRFKL